MRHKVLTVTFQHEQAKTAFFTVRQNRKGEPVASRLMYSNGRPDEEAQLVTLRLAEGTTEVRRHELAASDWDARQKGKVAARFMRFFMEGKDQNEILTSLQASSRGSAQKLRAA